MKTGFLLLLLSVFSKVCLSQQLLRGGLANTGTTLVLVGNSKENQVNQTRALQAITYLNFDDSKDKIQFAPQLPNKWNWVALFNVNTKGKKLNFFMYDGWMAATERITSNHRLRRFEDDISATISSNAYHIAFQRKQVVENEVFMLVVSPKKQKVVLQLSKEQFGVERKLEYEMEAWEAKFVHIVMPPPEYTVITWQPENSDRKQEPITQWKFLFDKDGSKEKTILRETKLPAGTRTAPAASNTLNWTNTTVPHTWNATDIFDSRNFKDSINIMELFQRGDGWYQTTITLPNSEKNKEHQLHFLGANQVTEAWLNGSYLGKHTGGYTGFSFPISKYLRYGVPNTLVVKVNNRFDYDIPPHTADYNFLGGIYREVYLVTTNASK
jgi:Glycosyl hydrolases family 2, sugar binding domain